MDAKVQIVFYSTWGHIYKMAEAVGEGVNEVEGVSAELLQVQELMPADVVEAMGATQARASFAHVPMATVEGLASADAIIFGSPTRYGCMTAQMRNFLDQTGSLWMKGGLLGKLGSAFTSTGTQHGGQELTNTSFHSFFLHHGMLIAGLPYAVAPNLSNVDKMLGGTPYGASTIAGPDGSRQPSEEELGMARLHGKWVAQNAVKLKG